MRLTESIHWVGSGDVGPGFTHPGDCSVYLLRGPEGFVMIDSGGGQEPELIERQLAWDGVPLNSVRAILLTHPHCDHAGGAAYWKRRCGAQVVTPEGCADYVRRGGDYHPAKPGVSVIAPCAVDQEARDGAPLNLCGLEFHPIAAPGHCASMFMYRVNLDERKVLVAGDSFYWGGKITVFAFPDASLTVFRKTLVKLQDCDFDAFLPGHRYPVLWSGKKHLNLALEETDRQLAGLPPMKG